MGRGWPGATRNSRPGHALQSRDEVNARLGGGQITGPGKRIRQAVSIVP